MSDQARPEDLAEGIGRLAQRVAIDELRGFTRSLRDMNVITEEQYTTIDDGLIERAKEAGMAFED